MPIYEYQCESCGHVLDALQKIGDAPLKKCPDCGRPKLKRLLSAPMFLLKGTGWYETDFKSDKERKRNLADRPEKETAPAEDKQDGSAPAKAEKAADKPAEAAKESKPAAPSATRGPRPRPRTAHKPRPKAKARRR